MNLNNRKIKSGKYYTINKLDNIDTVFNYDNSEDNYGYIVVLSEFRPNGERIFYEVPPTLMFDTKEEALEYVNSLDDKEDILENHYFDPIEYFEETLDIDLPKSINVGDRFFSYNENNSAPDEVFVTGYSRKYGHVSVRSFLFGWYFSVHPRLLFESKNDALKSFLKDMPNDKFIDLVLKMKD